MGFAYLVAPSGRRERRRWFGLAGWVPEGLLGQAGRFIPWRTLAEFRPAAGAAPEPAPEGVVIGLPVTAEGLRRWDEAKRRRHLAQLVETLAGRGAKVLGCGDGLGGSEGPAVGAGGAPDPVREAAHEVYGPEGAWLVGEWAGPLAGTLAAAEHLATARNWDCERAEVVVVGGETAAGRVAARLLARRFGRLTLAGEAPAQYRLAEQILHETGTAARVSLNWGRMLSRAALVVLAAPWPAGAAALLRPETVALAAGSGIRTAADVLFSWPAGEASGELAGVFWPGGAGESRLPGGHAMVASGLAAVAATAAQMEERGSASGGGAQLRLVTGREPSLGGTETLRRALDRCGFRPAALLDKAGAVLL